MDELKYSRVDLFFNCVGLLFSVLDIMLDIYAVVCFYKEKTYMYLGIQLVFLLGSLVLVQIYSWLFYSYDDFERKTRFLSWRQLKVLHVFQLGIFFRWYEFLRFAKSNISVPDQEGITKYLSHDLDFLRLIETFSESAPQLVLMLTITVQQGHLDYITVLKAFGSASAIAISVTMYHRSIHSFLPDQEKYPPFSLVVCFLWNLFLISSRLTALALFASVLPCFIFIHFVCSWIVLFFFAWRSETDFMDSPCGEWLYGATVGLIWYFNWFNLVKGRTIYRTLLYHGYILVDNLSLCILWCWKMNTDPPYFKISHSYAIIIAAVVVSVYIFGLLFKLLYYKSYHQNFAKEELKGGPTGDEVGAGVMFRSTASSPEPDVKHYNERMRKLAENFYACNCSFCP